MERKINGEIKKIYQGINGTTVNEFCKQCGISKNTYDKVLNNSKYKSITLIKIALLMKIHFEELFIHAR